VASSAQTHYALRVLRYHGLNTAALQHVYRATVYRATVVARITYAANAWHGFTKASERQRIDKVMDRARCLGYYPPDAPTFGDLCDTVDDELFSKARPRATRSVTAVSCRVTTIQLPATTTLSNCLNIRLSYLILTF